MLPAKPLKDRIEASSIPEPNSGCWLWLGAYDRDGYGRLQVGPGSPKAAHRASWEAFNGTIPHGLYVLHRCDLPACVNPDHLWLGTHSDNMRDCSAKGRLRRPQATRAIVGATYIARTNRWQAQFSGQYLGLFKTQTEASAAYWTARNGAPT